MVEDDAFRVAVIAIFAAVNGSMMPSVNWVNGSAIRTHPDVRMSSSVLLNLRCIDTSLQNGFFHFKCHSISLSYVRFTGLLDSGYCDATHWIPFFESCQNLRVLLNSGKFCNVLS